MPVMKRKDIMNNDKIVLYGMGAHAKNALAQYHVPVSKIEAVIDNSPEKVREFLEGSGIQVYTWEEFVNGEGSVNCPIIISSFLHQEEIKRQILNSGLFREDQIVYIDEWCSKAMGEESADTYWMHDQYKRLKDMPKIKDSALKNAMVLSDRISAIKRMPKGLVAAEVGVAFGDLSEKIFEIMQPEKFYGIDVFQEDVKGFWNDNKFEKSGMTHLQWYENRFRHEIETGRFEVRQGFSWDVLAMFPDAYFDYVYLDAAHDYDCVLKDVTMLKKKVKEGGIIQFNDYIRYDYNGGQVYGVCPVVNQFIDETNSEVLYYCLSLDGYDDIVVRYLR